MRINQIIGDYQFDGVCFALLKSIDYVRFINHSNSTIMTEGKYISVNKMKRVLFLLMFLSLVSCELDNKPGAHMYIQFVNNSDIDIFVSKAPWVPPDSLCYYIVQTYSNQYDSKVDAHSSSIRPLSLGSFRKDTWENYLSHIRSGGVIIFVHDAKKSDSICNDNNINWKAMNESERIELYSFLNQEIILKRYYYTLDDLDSANWNIVYP